MQRVDHVKQFPSHTRTNYMSIRPITHVYQTYNNIHTCTNSYILSGLVRIQIDLLSHTPTLAALSFHVRIAENLNLKIKETHYKILRVKYFNSYHGSDITYCYCHVNVFRRIKDNQDQISMSGASTCLISAREKLTVCDVTNLPSISIYYGYFVTSLSGYFVFEYQCNIL